jgi:hypothetical protein
LIQVIKVSRDDGSITVVDAEAGTISITIPASKTDVRPGEYTDALRVTIAGEPQTMWSGQIVVEGSPFLSVVELSGLPKPPLRWKTKSRP